MAISAVVNQIPLRSTGSRSRHCNRSFPYQSSASTLLPVNFFGTPLVKNQPGWTSINKKPVVFVGPRNEIEQESKEEEGKQSVSLSLEDVNPIGLGRKSRQIFDEVWRKFSELGQLSRSPRPDDELETVLVGGPMCEFTIPGAQDTTVLVVGATSRIGRIVVRKLMLRGYKVKALIRNADPEILEMLPRSVQIVVGDVGEPSILKSAVEGCNKIIYCATARSTITGDLNRVDHLGVYNLSKAFQDYNHRLAQLRAGRSSKSKLLIAKFNHPKGLEGWEVQQGTYFDDVVASKYDGGMDAKFEFKENGNAVFSGYVFTRGGYVELTKKLSLPLGFTLDRYEGLLFSVGGDGKTYTLILESGPSGDTSQSKLYFTRFATRVGFSRVRVPFSAFRPVKPDDPPLDPFLVHTLRIRFEPRKQRSTTTIKQAVRDNTSFKLILEYIKALPQLTSLKNRENEGLERLARMDDMTLAEHRILGRAGLLRVSRSRQMVMDVPLLLEMLATWDALTHVFHLPGGDLTITPRLVRRITGLPDSGPAAVLDSAIRGMEEKEEAHRFFTGAGARVQRRGIPLSEILSSGVPELRKVIVLLIMHRISHSTNYYDVPCGWMRAVERVEAGERLNWAALVARGMITRLDALVGRTHGDYSYCSILICMLFDFYPRTAPRGQQRVLMATSPCINRWEMRWRRRAFPAERFAGGASVGELRARDLVADPYAEVAWESDAEGEEEPGAEPGSPGHSGDRPGSAEGSQGLAGQGQAPPPQEESVELVDSDQEESDEEIARRLEAYFPGIEHHRLLVGAPPVAEAGHAWERAAMVRDAFRAVEMENARLQGQVSLLEAIVMRRERRRRSDSRSQSSRSQQSPSVQQRSGQASRGEPSQGVPPPP